LGGGIAGNGRLFGEDDFDALESADAAVANEFGHAMIDRHGAIFGAGLEDALVAAHGIDEDLAFVDGEGWLFALDILAGAEGEHADEGMPMIRGGDHHGVDVGRARTSRKSPVIGAIAVEVLFVDDLLGAAHALGVDVADGEDPGIVEVEVTSEVPAGAVIAGADEADGDAVAGGAMLLHDAVVVWSAELGGRGGGG
jgi:hypothetical protein